MNHHSSRILFRRYLGLVILFMLLNLFPSGNTFSQSLPNRYHGYIEMRNILTSLRDTHPTIVKLDTVGYSTRYNIPMLRIKISNSPQIDQDKPAEFICGGAHANEVLGPEVVLGFLQNFLQRYDSNDQQVINLVNSLEIFVVPFINPEGHVVVENGNFGWRKNQCDNDSNGIFNIHDGVDNNRNYDIGWNLANTPDAIVPDSAQYRGTAPFTQNENIAMRDFGERYHPVVALDYHSPFFGLSEVCYYPWYWRTSDGGHGPSPDEPMMAGICRQFSSMIQNDAGDSTYRSRRGIVQEGDYNSYFYGTFGSVVFTIEVSTTTIQDPGMVDGIVARNIPAIYFLLDRALGGRITGVVRDSVTLEPLEAEVRVMERVNDDIRPRMTRGSTGRYDRILGPGTYSLGIIKDGYYPKLIGNVAVADSPVTNDVLLSPIYPRPPAPNLQYPSDGQGMNENQFNFDWSDVDLANRYFIEIAADSLFRGIILSDSNIMSSSFALPYPLNHGQYYWHVKGGNSNGWGPYSTKFGFTVNVQSSADENPVLPREPSLNQNYPNPFNAHTVIGYDLDTSSKVSLYIFSLQGNLVTQLINGKDEESGHHSILWDGRDMGGHQLASGTYFYELFVNGYARSKMMVMVK